MLYPKGEMKAALDARPDLYPIIFAHLQSLTGEHLIKEGRVYGGGLHKMEPKELANLPAGEIARMIQKQPRGGSRVQCTWHEEVRQNNKTTYIFGQIITNFLFPNFLWCQFIFRRKNELTPIFSFSAER